MNITIKVQEFGPPSAAPLIATMRLCSRPIVPRTREPALEAPDAFDLAGLAYTAVLSGVGGSTGTALAEIYTLP